MKNYMFLFLLLVLPSTTNALAPQDLSYMAINAERQNHKPTFPLLSSLSFDNGSPKYMMRADGEYIYNNPGNVVSSYYYLDTTANINSFTHNVSHFYKSNRPRFNVMLHYLGWLKGTVFSLGLDSGHNSQKLDLTPAIFIGYTQAVKMSPTSHIAFGAGSWFGGKVKESSCVDDYNRQYWCYNLTAWDDRPNQSSGLEQYVNVTFTNRF